MQLTVRDVAALFNVSEKTVYRWITQAEIPAYRVNKQYRFHRAELLEWATARKIHVSPEILAEPRNGGAPLPALTDALEAGGIFYRLDGADKKSVLRAAVAALRLPDDVDRDFLLRMLLAREELASTGIGEGIAIPHVRNPIVLDVARPSVTLLFLEKPVDFGAVDGQPVRVLFTLVSPTVRTHLHLLSRLAFALRNPAVREVIARQGLRNEILAAFRQAEDAVPQPAAAEAS